MINKYTPTMEVCPSCRQSLLDHIGTQSYCNKCNQLAPCLTQEVQVVPELYQSNCKSKSQLEKSRRINALIRQFSSKHVEIQESEELRTLRERIKRIRDCSTGKKCLRQTAAVVVYDHMGEQIKMTIRQYCRNNNLSVKVFNQKYKIHKKIKLSSEIYEEQEQDVGLKEEEFHKIQESPTEKESDLIYEEDDDDPGMGGARIEEEQRNGFIRLATHALKIIYDHLFSNYFFRQKKNVIVGGLVQKFEEITGGTLGKVNYLQDPPLKTYYILFAVIKSLKYKINFFDFAKIILQKTGYIIKRKPAGQIKKIYQEQFSAIANMGCNIKIEESELPLPVKTEAKKSKKRGANRNYERIDLSDQELSGCE